MILSLKKANMHYYIIMQSAQTKKILKHITGMKLGLFTRSLTYNELFFLYRSLKTCDDDEVIVAALLIITDSDLDIVVDFTQKFHLFPSKVRQLAIPLMACTDFVEIYDYLLKYLKDNSSSEEAVVIIYSLSVSHYYGLLPLLLGQLLSENKIYVRNIKNILLKMGLKIIAPQLLLFPQIPHEAVFRELFGDEKIEAIKKSR